MKLFHLAPAVLLAAALGGFSISTIRAQTPGAQPCPGSGMMGGTASGMMQGMRGPADQAYMQSMTGMHQGMRGAVFTGDADHDFLVMMIPHHQAAIDMAQTELQYGKNPKLRAMAQQIVKTQQAEIDRMRAMLPQQR